jgi:hypothetical protein
MFGAQTTARRSSGEMPPSRFLIRLASVEATTERDAGPSQGKDGEKNPA